MKYGIRKHVLFGAVASLLALGLAPAAHAQKATVVKISHQFPGGTIDEGDFRDRLVRKFAQEVEKRSDGALRLSNDITRARSHKLINRSFKSSSSSLND